MVTELVLEEVVVAVVIAVVVAVIAFDWKNVEGVAYYALMVGLALVLAFALAFVEVVALKTKEITSYQNKNNKSKCMVSIYFLSTWWTAKIKGLINKNS